MRTILRSVFLTVVLGAGALSAGGCSTSIGDITGSAAQPTHERGFLPVNDTPLARDVTLEPADRNKMQSELVAARDRQAATVAAEAAAAAARTAAQPK